MFCLCSYILIFSFSFSVLVDVMLVACKFAAVHCNEVLAHEN